MGMGQLDHIVASYVAERVEHGAQTGVSMPVVRDGESFLDALFAFARQDRGTRNHRLQVGGRRRKLFGRALRVRLPRLRHLAASATIRGLKSTTDRLAATGSRRSRGHAQPAAQRLPIVEVKADMGFMVDVQTRSGAWYTFP